MEKNVTTKVLIAWNFHARNTANLRHAATRGGSLSINPGAKGRYSLVAQYVQCQATNDCRYMGKQYRQLNVIIQVEFYNNSCFDQGIEINESAPKTDCCVENTWRIIVQIIEAFHVLNVEPCFQNISKGHSFAL